MLGIDARTTLPFIDINIAETGDQRLVEQGVLDFAGPTRQCSMEALGSKAALEWLRSEATIEMAQCGAVGKDDPADQAGS